jgi:hypothetical protein
MLENVITQLSQHEHGVPEVPRQIMIPPKMDRGTECADKTRPLTGFTAT